MKTILWFGSASFLYYLLLAAVIQNAAFGRALGVSRLVKLTEDSREIWPFSALLLIVQLLTGMLSFWLAGPALNWLGSSLKSYFLPLFLVMCTVAVFFAVFFSIVFLFPQERAKSVARMLPVASFNCCVLGTLLLGVNHSFTFWQTVGFAAGSAIGYLMAIFLVDRGRKLLDRLPIAEPFRGLPATLVYLGILSLVVYGFTGHPLSV